jgi:hypothetical protein
MNFFVLTLGAAFLVGCGGSGGNSDVNLPYIEDSEFFTSSTLLDTDVTEREKGVAYYPVSDNVFNGFVDGIIELDFEIDEYDEYCYERSDGTADTCSEKINGKRYISMWLDNATADTTDEDVIEFFPKIDASLSARLLYAGFGSDKSADVSAFEEYLRNTLYFEPYDDGYSTSCSKKSVNNIIYSFCYDDIDYDAEWTIMTEALFNALY